MQPSIPPKSMPRSIKAPILSAGLMLAAALPVAAQGFPMAGPGGPGAPAGAPTTNLPLNENASRFVSPEGLVDYIAKYGSMFDITNRKSDPFGQLQDPTATPEVVATPSAPTRRYKPTSYADIIARIKIKAIMPGTKSFMTGNRSFKQGDQFPLRFRGKEIKVQVAAVSQQKVDFKNLSTGEVASVKLGLLPPGMNAGGGKFTAPGMVSDKPDAPLQLDPLSDF